MPFLFARRPVPGKNALTHTKPAAFLGCALCHLRRGAIRPSFLAAGLYFLEGALAEHAEDFIVLREQRREEEKPETPVEAPAVEAVEVTEVAATADAAPAAETKTTEEKTQQQA